MESKLKEPKAPKKNNNWPTYDDSTGLLLTARGLPLLCSFPQAFLERTLGYDLPALQDAPPWSFAQLFRNTNQEVQYYCFLFRAWPVSPDAAGLTFQPSESFAYFLAHVVRCLLGDHPGYLFMLRGPRLDRTCRVGVVPARHSRTKWLLSFGALIDSAPAFALHDSARSLTFACRFLTEPQHDSACEEPVLLADCPRFSCSAPTFLQDAPDPSDAFSHPVDAEDDEDSGDDGYGAELDDIAYSDMYPSSDEII
jgi:hypothetical protein